MMAIDVDTYAVHQTAWPLVLCLGVGWAAIFAGSLRWGLRFAVFALPMGLLIPASEFLLRPELWRALLDPEIAAWNAGYWLIPASIAVGLALLLRQRPPKVR